MWHLKKAILKSFQGADPDGRLQSGRRQGPVGRGGDHGVSGPKEEMLSQGLGELRSFQPCRQNLGKSQFGLCRRRVGDATTALQRRHPDSGLIDGFLPLSP